LTKPPDPDELAVRLEIAERILAVHDQLARQNARLAELATTDELTGVKNRRRFREDLDLLFAQADRQGSSLSLIMLDVDRFKLYNDEFGHPAGDEVLRCVGATLRTVVRDHDVVARYGGEEFAVLLPATDGDEAMLVAERIRSALACQPWPHRQVTASLGVATTDRNTPGASALVDQADQALYRCKQAGRNRICHFAHDAPLPVILGVSGNMIKGVDSSSGRLAADWEKPVEVF
jgi:diguanylate cyclase (GGDEF)-like protein